MIQQNRARQQAEAGFAPEPLAPNPPFLDNKHSMTVDFETAGDILILRLRGRFATGQDTSYLRTKAEEVKSSGKHKGPMDFHDVSYIDSTAIGFLIGIYTRANKLPDGQFVMTCPIQGVRGVRY